MDTESKQEVDASTNGHGDLEGESLDEMTEAIGELVIEGDGQLSLTVGGKKPDKGTVKLRSRSIGMPDGVFSKGDTVKLELTCNVAEVHFIDKRQGTTGEIVETERRHVLVISDVVRYDA